jgi:hypothetical protein
MGERIKSTDRVWAVLLLAAGAYLGFYVFGLVMGVYSVAGMVVLTIGAAVCGLLFLAYFIRGRRSADQDGQAQATRRARRLREGRGF